MLFHSWLDTLCQKNIQNEEEDVCLFVCFLRGAEPEDELMQGFASWDERG